MRKIAALLFLCFMPISLFAQTYKMYQTRNYHNQLRLNTATGEVLQVQDDGQSWKICGHSSCWIVLQEDLGKCNTIPSL